MIRIRLPSLHWTVAIAVTFGLGFGPAARAGSGDLCFRGVNISGAEYGDANGQEGVNFTYPSERTRGYFASKGFDTVRLPFRWERLQPSLGQPFDAIELERLKASVASFRGLGQTVILDPHNFGYYADLKLGSGDLPPRLFADFWIRLAAEFASEEGVVFGLMNEPHDIAPRDWLDAANLAIAGIRAVKAGNLVLVPGTYWSGVASWQSDLGQGANSEVMLGVKDPGDNFAFEVHQYMDADFSGTHEACVNADKAVAAIGDLSAWLRKHGKKAFLGEFGGSSEAACLAGIEKMADRVGADSDVWLGWTYWAGGDWWPPTEGNNIQPTAKGDRKQLSALKSALSAKGSGAGACAVIPGRG